MKNSWKSVKLNNLTAKYGNRAAKWESVNEGERLVYCNIYSYLKRGIECLPENPTLFVMIAINQKMDELTRQMDSIARRYAA